MITIKIEPIGILWYIIKYKVYIMVYNKALSGINVSNLNGLKHLFQYS